MKRKIRQKIYESKMKDVNKQLVWMSSYVKKYWMLIGVYTFLMTSSSLLGLGSTVISKDLIDIVTGQNTSNLMHILPLYVFAGVAQLIIGVIRSRLSLKISLKIQTEIREDIFKQIMQTDWESLSEYRTGDLLYRINGDTGMVSNFILTFIPSVVSVFISLLSAFWIMAYNDWVMALIVLIGAPISILTSQYTLKKSQELMKKNQAFASNKMSFDQETFNNIQMIKAFNLVPQFISKFHQVQRESMEISLNQNKFQSLNTVITSLVSQGIGFACYGYALYRLWTGDISYGTMTLFVGMARTLNSSFHSLINLVPNLLNSCISVGRIMEVICLPSEKIDHNPEVEQMLLAAQGKGLSVYMEDVSFWYQKETPIYEHASFYACPGEIIGLLGPSGQGKTTTLNLFLGLFHIRSGSLQVGIPNEKPMKISSATRSLFSYIPQGNTLFSGTIADNMRMVQPDASDEQIIDALKSACAWEFVSCLDDGINTMVKECGRRFSEGQKQRLSIARALLANRPIMLLDEATSALDMATERKVLTSILNYDTSRTLIVSSHRPSVFAMCHRVYRIESQTIREVGREEVNLFLEGKA